jgi:proline iminopeptidase
MRASQGITAAIVGLAGLLACETLDPTAPGNLVPRTVAEDPSLPAIDMNGSRFHFETFGNPANPVIVFVHGGPGSDYRSLLRLAERHNGYSLTDEYFLVYWDQRGTGLSKRHDKSLLTLDVYRSDFDSLVNRYSPGRPVLLIGESWGGMFATEFINRSPQRVAGAVLIEPGPLDGATAARIENDIFDLDMTSEWLNDFAWASQFLSPDDHIRMDYERMLGAKNSQPKYHENKENPSPVWRMGAAASRYIAEDGQDENGHWDYDFTTNLAAFTTPVLFLAGAWSEVQGESLQQEQILHYPSASLQVIDGAGHDVAWVKTPEVLAQIRTYLDGLKGAAR